jgi:hypothetical protein
VTALYTEDALKSTPASLQIERKLQDGGNIFHLRTPIQIEVAEEDGMWHCESASLGIVAAGSSQQDALRSFTEDFGVLWDEIAQAPDADLTDDAIRLKYALRNIVESVDVAA